ncbi:hypothetical protein EV426DRAFT_448429 [Tirmania nivea]|nr:hypothetical protein EV426DRAFT_448429 [Tirmania nivea]
MNVFQYYHQFKRLAHNEMSFPNTVSIVHKLQKALNELILSADLYSYNENIISIYEEIATLLLFLGWPDQVITLNSWRELYLSHWIEFLKLLPHFGQQTIYQYLLYRLMLSFCDMVMRLQDQVTHELPPPLQGLLARRSIDFLLIVLLNFRNINPRLNFYWVLSSKVQEVSFSSTCLAVSYSTCNNKDGLPGLQGVVHSCVTH